ncbi:MAG: App1 family protein [Ferruginibacter sp.]
MTNKATYLPEKKTILQKIQLKVFALFRLHNGSTIKLYKGFANDKSCAIYGHAFSLSPIKKKHFRKFFLYNAMALLRLFMVKPIKGATVTLQWNDKIYTALTASDGFFKFEWDHHETLAAGQYEVEVILIKRGTTNIIKSKTTSHIIVPSATSFSFISDIDDTFLISHSSNLRKRLFVLLTENARSRKPFEGVVEHYRLLHDLDEESPASNAFFYVSSSEWNLYDYIKDFLQEHRLPDGVCLLNQVKTLSKLLSTGQNNHAGKFTRIVKIIEAYPHQKFVLLGDDSQEDIDIYTSIVEHFPHNVYCVYIRRVSTPEKENVLLKQKLIEENNVLFCYFAHSEDAIIHSKKIGLIR